MSELKLSDLKAGDPCCYTHGREDKIISQRIEKITPSGRIVTQRGTWNADGTLRGDDNVWSVIGRLQPRTRENNDKIVRQAQIIRLNKTEWGALDNETLCNVISAINTGKVVGQ